jgi:hypothetical protein
MRPHSLSPWAVACVAVLLLGCAARTVRPVAMSQPGDATLSCAAIDAQMANNATAAADFLHRDQQLEGRNAAAVGASLLIGLPAVALMDLTREEQIQFRALSDRNQHLQSLKDTKPC